MKEKITISISISKSLKNDIYAKLDTKAFILNKESSLEDLLYYLKIQDIFDETLLAVIDTKVVSKSVLLKDGSVIKFYPKLQGG